MLPHVEEAYTFGMDRLLPYVEVAFSFGMYWLLLHIEVACAFERREPLSPWVLTPNQLNLAKVFNIELCFPSLPSLSYIDLTYSPPEHPYNPPEHHITPLNSMQPS